MGVGPVFEGFGPFRHAKNGIDYNKTAFPALSQEDICSKACYLTYTT